MTLRHLGTPFSSYLTVRTFEVEGAVHEVLSGPGHDVVVVTCYVSRPQAEPVFVLKRGDTRPSRVLRGTAYVKDGLVAGRLDHAGSPAEAIARAEVEEEVGGRVVGEPVFLGDHPVPTMPVASTEADIYLLAEARFEPGQRARGDGGGMEVPDLLGAVFLSPSEILERIRKGRVGEASRARVAFGRAFEKLGLLTAVPVLQGELEERQTLGLGPIIEPEGPGADGALPREVEGGEAVDGAEIEIARSVELPHLGGRLVDAKARHLAGRKAYGEVFPVQILDVPFDEVEILPYALDEQGVPWVRLERRRQPALLVKEVLGSEVRSRLLTPSVLWSGVLARSAPNEAHATARRVAEERGFLEPEHLISSEASPGQSTLGEHVFSAPLKRTDADLVRIDQALVRAREDGASARTEAGLLELAGRA